MLKIPPPSVEPRPSPQLRSRLKGKGLTYIKNHFILSRWCKSNSHQVLPYLQRLCSLLQIKAFIVSIGWGAREGQTKKNQKSNQSCPCNATGNVAHPSPWQRPPTKKASLHLFSATLKNVKLSQWFLERYRFLVRFLFFSPRPCSPRLAGRHLTERFHISKARGVFCLFGFF